MPGTIQARKQVVMKKRRFVLTIIAGVLVLAALIALAVILLSGDMDLGTVMKQVLMKTADPMVSDESNVFFCRDGTLHCIDEKNQERWSAPLFASDVWLCMSKNAVAAYNKDTIKVFDRSGATLFDRTFQQEIIQASCGDVLVAVVLKDDDGVFTVFVTDFAGDPVETIKNIPGRYVMQTGFFGKDSLYALAMDTSGTLPVTCISTYQPGKSMTSVVTIQGELVEKLIFTADSMYAVTTAHVTQYTLMGEQKAQVLVYGWVLQDWRLDGGEPQMVFVSRSQLEKDKRISTLRLVKVSGMDQPVYLPPECHSVVAGKDKFYCFSASSVYAYDAKGKFLKQYPLPVKSDGAVSVMGGRAVIVSNGEASSISPLP